MDIQHLLVGDRPASRCRIGLGVNGYATLRLTGKVPRSMRSLFVSLSGPRMGCSRNHREAPAHHQNSSFNPYCMMRGFTLMALIFPKVLGLETKLAGFAKFG